MMLKSIKTLILILAFSLIFSSIAFAVGKNVPILFAHTKSNSLIESKSLKDILVVPAGYTNVKEVNSFDDFKAEWANRTNYGILIFSYHGIQQDPALVDWLNKDGQSLVSWVKAGSVLIACAGRDPEEKPLADLFELSFDESTKGQTEPIVPLELGTPFAKGIDGNKLDASASSDNTPLNGEFYKDPLPKWVEYVVTKNAAGKPTMVAGRYEKGVLLLGTFEITNIGAGIDVAQSMFPGFTKFWANMLDWAASSATSVNSKGKLTTTWGQIKSYQ
jgi:hypothetical protein